jgi:hypothetical protein
MRLILILSSLPSLGVTSEHLSSPMRATRPGNFIFRDIISLVLPGE